MSYTVSVTSGTATVTLTKAGGVPSSNMQTLVNGMSYQDTSQDPTAATRTITLTQVQDTGGTANGGVDTTTLAIAANVTVVPVNDAPTLSATASNPTFQEASGFGTQAAAVSVFSGANASTVEAGQTITGSHSPSVDWWMVRMKRSLWMARPSLSAARAQVLRPQTAWPIHQLSRVARQPLC